MEKERRLREMQKSMGMKLGVYFLTIFIFNVSKHMRSARCLLVVCVFGLVREVGKVVVVRVYFMSSSFCLGCLGR